MSGKSLFMMDTPGSCMGCNFLVCDGDTNIDSCMARETAMSVDLEKYDKPDWCPLKPVPEKKEALEVPKIPSLIDFRRKGFQDGWNACIDEIAGGAEWVD